MSRPPLSRPQTSHVRMTWPLRLQSADPQDACHNWRTREAAWHRALRVGPPRTPMCVSHGFASHKRNYDRHLEPPPWVMTPNLDPVDPESPSEPPTFVSNAPKSRESPEDPIDTPLTLRQEKRTRRLTLSPRSVYLDFNLCARSISSSRSCSESSSSSPISRRRWSDGRSKLAGAALIADTRSLKPISGDLC